MNLFNSRWSTSMSRPSTSKIKDLRRSRQMMVAEQKHELNSRRQSIVHVLADGWPHTRSPSAKTTCNPESNDLPMDRRILASHQAMSQWACNRWAGMRRTAWAAEQATWTPCMAVLMDRHPVSSISLDQTADADRKSVWCWWLVGARAADVTYGWCTVFGHVLRTRSKSADVTSQQFLCPVVHAAGGLDGSCPMRPVVWHLACSTMPSQEWWCDVQFMLMLSHAKQKLIKIMYIMNIIEK